MGNTKEKNVKFSSKLVKFIREKQNYDTNW